MNSKLMKITTMLFFALLLFSMGSGATKPTPVQSIPLIPANSANPMPGDTHVYNITTGDFPLGLALEEEGIELTGTFTGSKIYAKILRNGTSPDLLPNTFQLGMFFVLGADLTLNFQPTFENYSDIPEDLREMTIPQGMAVPLGESLSWIAGSGFWPEDNDTENEDDYFIPLYAENFDILASAITAKGGTVLTDTTSEFSITWTESEDDETITFALTWRKSDGLLTKFSATATQGLLSITGTAELLETKKRPLPDSLTVNSTHAFTATEANLDLEINSALQTLLGLLGEGGDTLNEFQLEANIASMKDKIIFNFTINSIDGVFYNGTFSTLNITSGEYESPVAWVMVNGFTGTIWNASDPELLEESDLAMDFFAPGITPDWELWSGLADGAGTLIGSDFLAYLRSNNFAEELEGQFTEIDPMGFPLPGPIQIIDHSIDIGVDWSQESGFNYISAFAAVNAKILMADESAGFEARIELGLDGNIWVAYQPSGLLAGTGLAATGDLAGTYEAMGLKGDPKAKINNLELVVKNNAITQALSAPSNPGGERHPEEESSKDEDDFVSGFTFLWILIPLFIIPIFIRRRLS
jgi:hypothetical protein